MAVTRSTAGSYEARCISLEKIRDALREDVSYEEFEQVSHRLFELYDIQESMLKIYSYYLRQREEDYEGNIDSFMMSPFTDPLFGQIQQMIKPGHQYDGYNDTCANVMMYWFWHVHFYEEQEEQKD